MGTAVGSWSLLGDFGHKKTTLLGWLEGSTSN